MARLLLQTVEGPRTIELSAFNSLGRHPNNTIQVLDRIASKEHCLIELRDGRFVLRDRGSMNGTYVNGERAHGPVVLADGDEISLGSTRAIFHAGAEPEVSPVAEPRVGELPTERILVHLATDKAIYRPGEVLYARGAVLDAETHAPASPSNLAFEVRDAQGDVLVSRLSHAAEGVAPFSWALPADLDDGEHLLFARCPTETFPPAELSFTVRAERSPALATELELSRSAYAPGDEVLAALWAGSLEGRALVGASVSATATLDGEEIAREELTLDGEGRGWLRFRLPAHIERGAGAVQMHLRAGEAQASVSCAIPIPPTRILLALHPEGGDLVVGLPARLYLEARTPLGAPAEVAGHIVDDAGAVLAHFHTEHEGRGRVMILPARAGRAYAAVLDEPAGFPERFPLPDVAHEGLSLIALDDRSDADDPLHFRVASTAAMRARLSIHRRDHEVAAFPIDLAAGEVKDLSLKVPVSATGVLRATLHDALGRPRAERLIFRRPQSELRVEIEALPRRLGPRAPVSLRVRTTARGKPVAATVMLAVVDDRVLAQPVPRRACPPQLPEQVLLGTEVSELGDPSAYLEEGNASARRLDLLLGTQGFRRFAFYDLSRFLGEHGDRAERVLARRKPPVVAVTQAVSLLPETVPMAPLGRPRAPGLPGSDPSFALTPEPAAVFHRVAPAQHQPGKGASGDGLLPPLPGPPLPMGAPSAQKPAISGIRGRHQTSAAPPPPVGRMVTVREFSYRIGSAAGPGPDPRGSTLYWSAGITSSVNGEVTVEFDLPDGVSSFRARADAFSALGALGGGEATITCAPPFTIEPRLPVEVCAGDVLDIPLTLSNATLERVDGRLFLSVDGPLIIGRDPISFSIAPESRERILIPAAVISGRGRATLHLRAVAGPYAASVHHPIDIVPAGFPVEIGVEGRLDADGTASHCVRVPESIEPGSLTAELRLHPSALAALSSAFEALLDAPALCPEARSSRASLAAALLDRIDRVPGGDPRLIRRAKQILDERSPADRTSRPRDLAPEPAFPDERRAGTLSLSVDGEPVATQHLDAEQRSVIVLASFAEALSPGERTIALRMTGGSPLTYALRLRCHARTPPPADEAPLVLTQDLSAEEVTEGETVELTIGLENRSDLASPSVTAILGLPAGLELDGDAMERLSAEPFIDRAELRGRELMLALRSLAPRAPLRIAVALRGAIPGTYRGPASRAYLGEAACHPAWAAPLTIRVLTAR